MISDRLEKLVEDEVVVQAGLGLRRRQDVGGGEIPDRAESGFEDRMPVVVFVVRRHQREPIRRQPRGGVGTLLGLHMPVLQRVRKIPGRIGRSCREEADQRQRTKAGGPWHSVGNIALLVRPG